MDKIRLTNYNMASARLIGALLFTPFMFAASFFLFRSRTSGIAQLVAIGAPFVAIYFVWMAVTVVTSLTVGDDLVVHNFFRSNRYALTDIQRIDFGTEATRINGIIPIANHLMLHIILRSGRHLQLKVDQGSAHVFSRVLRERGLDHIVV